MYPPARVNTFRKTEGKSKTNKKKFGNKDRFYSVNERITVWKL